MRIKNCRLTANVIVDVIVDLIVFSRPVVWWWSQKRDNVNDNVVYRTVTFSGATKDGSVCDRPVRKSV